MFVENFRVESPRVQYSDGEIQSEYRYDTTEVVPPGNGGAAGAGWVVRPKSVTYNFKTSTNVPKLGCVDRVNPSELTHPPPQRVRCPQPMHVYGSTACARPLRSISFRE